MPEDKVTRQVLLFALTGKRPRGRSRTTRYYVSDVTCMVTLWCGASKLPQAAENREVF